MADTDAPDELTSDTKDKEDIEKEKPQVEASLMNDQVRNPPSPQTTSGNDNDNDSDCDKSREVAIDPQVSPQAGRARPEDKQEKSPIVTEGPLINDQQHNHPREFKQTTRSGNDKSSKCLQDNHNSRDLQTDEQEKTLAISGTLMNDDQQRNPMHNENIRMDQQVAHYPGGQFFKCQDNHRNSAKDDEFAQTIYIQRKSDQHSSSCLSKYGFIVTCILAIIVAVLSAYVLNLHHNFEETVLKETKDVCQAELLTCNQRYDREKEIWQTDLSRCDQRYDKERDIWQTDISKCNQRCDKEKESLRKELSTCDKQHYDKEKVHGQEKLDQERSAWKELDKTKQSCQEKLDKEKDLWQVSLSACNRRFNEREKIFAQEKLEKEKIVQKELEEQKEVCKKDLEKEKKQMKTDLEACNKRLNEKSDESTFVKSDLASYRGMFYMGLIIVVIAVCAGGFAIAAAIPRR